jgi:hypothetical protein
MNQPKAWAGFDLASDLPPVIAIERTSYGWRGITADGEVLEVRGADGVAPPFIPESIMVMLLGAPVGRRKVITDNVVNITAFLSRFNSSAKLHRANRNEEALVEIDAAIALVPTLRARFNRAMILLALGRWQDGFAEFELCERETPFSRPMSNLALAAGIRPWRGEDLAGARLLLVHDHGFGDALMTLRYVPVLRMMGADVVLSVPAELRRIARQFGEVVDGLVDADCFVSFLQLLRWLREIPESVPTGMYVRVDPFLAEKWREKIGSEGGRRRIGVAWQTRVSHSGDFPRELPLADLLARIDVGDAEVFSVQSQGREEAELRGVRAHEFEDFADAAALMSLLDEIVSVDTAAIHLAGAIGHPNATVLLSEWHSWRWRGPSFGLPFYPDVRIREM